MYVCVGLAGARLFIGVAGYLWLCFRLDWRLCVLGLLDGMIALGLHRLGVRYCSYRFNCLIFVLGFVGFGLKWVV